MKVIEKMKKSAKKQLTKIASKDVSDIISKQIPDKFNNMLLDEEIRRSDYYLIKYNTIAIERSLRLVNIPHTSSNKQIHNKLKTLKMYLIIKAYSVQ